MTAVRTIKWTGWPVIVVGGPLSTDSQPDPENINEYQPDMLKLGDAGTVVYVHQSLSRKHALIALTDLLHESSAGVI